MLCAILDHDWQEVSAEDSYQPVEIYNLFMQSEMPEPKEGMCYIETKRIVKPIDIIRHKSLKCNRCDKEVIDEEIIYGEEVEESLWSSIPANGRAVAPKINGDNTE